MYRHLVNRYNIYIPIICRLIKNYFIKLVLKRTKKAKRTFPLEFPKDDPNRECSFSLQYKNDRLLSALQFVSSFFCLHFTELQVSALCLCTAVKHQI